MTPPKPQDWIILGLAFGSFAAIWMLIFILESPMNEIKEQYWSASLFFNLLSYSAIFFPGFLVLRYVAQTNFLESGPQPKMLSSFIKLCYYGNQEELDESIIGTAFLESACEAGFFFTNNFFAKIINLFYRSKPSF